MSNTKAERKERKKDISLRVTRYVDYMFKDRKQRTNYDLYVEN